ncbi:MAG: hypothetical protein PWQ82_1817 [Thermosediminibacterales bacterium]|nr:hypothetical protein [Thermosediminibacterales bacterium]
MSMFCFQCQETAKGTGCTVIDLCAERDFCLQYDGKRSRLKK